MLLVLAVVVVKVDGGSVYIPSENTERDKTCIKRLKQAGFKQRKLNTLVGAVNTV